MTHTLRVERGSWDRRILAFQVERLVTAYAVLTERYVVLIDTLFSPSLVASALEALPSDRPLIAVNTHAHWDHAWGNSALVGPSALRQTMIISHRRGPDLLLSEESRAELSRRQSAEPETYASVRLQPATLLIDGETVIDGGDLHLVILPTPGHEPDHLAVFIPELRTLFPGDAAEWPLPFISDHEMLPAMRHSFDRMLALDPQVVLYAHAPGRSDPAVLRANKRYFDDLEQRVRSMSRSAPAKAANPELLINYPFETVPGFADLNPDEQSFYRDAHHAAIRATLANRLPPPLGEPPSGTSDVPIKAS